MLRGCQSQERRSMKRQYNDEEYYAIPVIPYEEGDYPEHNSAGFCSDMSDECHENSDTIADSHQAMHAVLPTGLSDAHESRGTGMREQSGVPTSFTRRAPRSDVQTASRHRVGTSHGVHPEDLPYQTDERRASYRQPHYDDPEEDEALYETR